MSVVLTILAWGLLMTGLLVGILGIKLEAERYKSAKCKKQSWSGVLEVKEKPYRIPSMSTKQVEEIKAIKEGKTFSVYTGSLPIILKTGVQDKKVEEYVLIKDELLGEYYRKTISESIGG